MGNTNERLGNAQPFGVLSFAAAMVVSAGACDGMVSQSDELAKAQSTQPAQPLVLNKEAKQKKGPALAMAANDPGALARVLSPPRQPDKHKEEPRAVGKAAEEAHKGKAAQTGGTSAERTEAAGPEGVFEVTELTFARQVQEREPIDDGDAFVAGEGRVFAHARVNSSESDRKIVVVFKHHDRETYRAELDVGKSPRWRTWASISAAEANVGSWTVDVEDEQGSVLASRKFEIQKALSSDEERATAAESTQPTSGR